MTRVPPSPDRYLTALCDEAHAQKGLRTPGERVLYVMQRLEVSGEVVELAPNRGPIIDWFNRRRAEEQYGLPDDAPGAAWCASSLLRIIEKLGHRLPSSVRPGKGWRYWENRKVSAWLKATKRDGVHMGRYIVPRVGEVHFSGSRGLSDPGQGSHVDIVERVRWEAGICWIDLLGGNVGNRIARNSMRLGDSRSRGFARILGDP